MVEIEIRGTSWVRRCANAAAKRDDLKLLIRGRWKARMVQALLRYEHVRDAPKWVFFVIPIISAALGALLGLNYRLTAEGLEGGGLAVVGRYARGASSESST